MSDKKSSDKKCTIQVTTPTKKKEDDPKKKKKKKIDKNTKVPMDPLGEDEMLEMCEKKEKHPDDDKGKNDKKKSNNDKDQKGNDPKKPKGSKKGAGQVTILTEDVIPDFACEEPELDNELVVEVRPRLYLDCPVVNPFSISHIGMDFTICFFGKRREGKSFAMDWILFNLREFIPRVYVFTNTKFNYFWQKRIPTSKIFSGFHEGVLFEIIETQKKIITALKDAGFEEEDRKRIARCCIVLDDCITADLHHSEVLKTLFFEGRHLSFLVMMSLQYAKGIPPGKLSLFGFCLLLLSFVY